MPLFTKRGHNIQRDNKKVEHSTGHAQWIMADICTVRIRKHEHREIDGNGRNTEDDSQHLNIF